MLKTEKPFACAARNDGSSCFIRSYGGMFRRTTAIGFALLMTILISTAGNSAFALQEESGEQAPAATATETQESEPAGSGSTTDQADDPTAQMDGLFVRGGKGVPVEVREIYEKGAAYLVESQSEDGGFASQTGVTALALMAMLSTGEDPNFGRYAISVRKATRFLITKQNKSTGYVGSSMYEHGFSMLALSEAYGALDDKLVWAGYDGSDEKKRTIGEALELCVRLAQTAQKKNTEGGWRYSPNDASADTSVSGAVLMGLLAARNAGIAVPDTVVDRALEYFQKMTSEGGTVAYAGMGGLGDSMARSSIACLVFSIGKRKEWEQFESVKKYLVDSLERDESGWEYYFRYYMAQALFQADYDAWQKWNQNVIKLIKSRQGNDGMVSGGSHGPVYSTSMSLLALALNYKFLPIYER